MGFSQVARRSVTALAAWLTPAPSPPGVCTDYEVLKCHPKVLRDGWKNPNLPQRQLTAFDPVLKKMRAGVAREDFLALAEAVRSTALDNPLIIEVGCGSAWNFEVLTTLLQTRVRYVGLDYSLPMARLGRAEYEHLPFLVADAGSLPIRDAACDILLSGTSLMHIPEYLSAIAEARRVSRRFAIFHTVTVHAHGDTTFLKKRAYGEWVPEIVFNESHLIETFRREGFAIKQSFESIPYDLVDVTGEPSVTKTFVCEAV